MSSSNLAALLEEVEEIPDATPKQWAVTRELLRHMAPDLLEIVTGEALA